MSRRIKFGTDGWRALIGKDFNLNNVGAVAQAIADYLTQNANRKPKTANHKPKAIKIVVGYDTRKLSRESARHISGVLAANKIKVILSQQPLPTPVISYTVRALRLSAGIMVTASHNPSQFNGIKIKGNFGGPVESVITKKIESFISRRKPMKIPLGLAQKRGLLKIRDLVPQYLKFLQSYLDWPLLEKGRLRILVDSMHGTADSYIAKILKKTSSRVTTVHQNYDFTFGGIKPEPIRSCLKEASSLMKKKNFDLALATDGDADRIAALDEQGRFVNPQQIMSVLLQYLVKYRKLKGAVVKTVAGTSLLERITKKYGLKIYETPIGFKHISDLMQKKDVLIGGEEAGGIGFKNYLPERDGILSGLLLLEALLANKKTITALLQDLEKEFGRYVYLRRDIKCLSAQKEKVRSALAKMRRRKVFLGSRIKKIKEYDGLKFYLASESWILFRLSGTEPVLRIYAESDSISKTKTLIAEGVRLLKL